MTGESLPVLVDRLRAELDRLEAIARTADGTHRWPPRLAHDRPQSKAAIELMKFHSPAHVLRTIQAHRKIIDRHRALDGADGVLVCRVCSFVDDFDLPDGAEYPCADVLALASIYFPESDATDG